MLTLLFLLVLLSLLACLDGFIFAHNAVQRPSQTLLARPVRGRVCDITGRRRNGMHNDISKSGVRTRRPQGLNIHYHKYWWEEGHKYVRLRIATRTHKTIIKNGLQATAKKYGINLNRFAISGRDPTNPAGKAPHKPTDYDIKLAEMTKQYWIDYEAHEAMLRSLDRPLTQEEKNSLKVHRG